MRPLRFLLGLTTCILAFVLLLSASRWRSSSRPSSIITQQRDTVASNFDWRSPSSLFPPSAVISLTDDNSTFFLARPAAFGPLLPAKSLSAPLWVGSGFGDQGAEGELGCTDIPGWDDGSHAPSSSSGSAAGIGRKSGTSEKTADVEADRRRKRSLRIDDEADEDDEEEQAIEDDGTDDHLHRPLSPSNSLRPNGAAAKKPAHADIQSLQETAEIAGKVVLLSRGGCGFLEKVKWAQRRGGVALIVGDDVPGGDLVIMYAQGDTSNVSIPAIFTSHTTAHLLSSLIPSEDPFDDDSHDVPTRLGLAAGKNGGSRTPAKEHDDSDRPNFTTTSTSAGKPTSIAKSRARNSREKTRSSEARDEDQDRSRNVGWFRSLLGGRSAKISKSDSSRPPSSGNLDWVLLEDFDENEGTNAGQGMIGKHVTTTVSSARGTSTKRPTKDDGDGFIIGVQDWRDPDLVAEQKERLLASTPSTSSSTSSEARPARSKAASSAKQGILEGGSITPGSGEYAKSSHEAVDLVSKNEQNVAKGKGKHTSAGEMNTKGDGGWFSRVFHHSSNDAEAYNSAPETQEYRKGQASHSKSEGGRIQSSHPTSNNRHHFAADPSHEHDGLWVTLTPNTVSSSSFLDTLLVLVVSPLVTLTVVYALLLLRSRIRRRRWRAPKSVVERLPVRTYRTMTSNSMPGSGVASAAASILSVSALSATTPLLSSIRESQPNTNTNLALSSDQQRHARPRSRTASAALPLTSSLHSRSASPTATHQTPEQAEIAIEEKHAAGLAEWRRRYGGKQRECVVCLEEYVDGISRVMSLPCGHEFHEGCITPWLTTRRRTCPICKGDVVRSLARPGSLLGSPPTTTSHIHAQPSASSPLLQAHIQPNATDDDMVPYRDEPSPIEPQENHAISPQPRSQEDLDLERGIALNTGSSPARSEAGNEEYRA